MKKRHKVLLLVVGILLSISIIVSISYAYYIFSVSQSDSNVVHTDCFKITFSDGDDINIDNAFPLDDMEVNNLEPYTFTIKNICNNIVDYNVNIETLDDTTMDLNAIATNIDGSDKKILGAIDENDNVVNNNVISSKTIYSGMLRAGEEKTHSVRLWLDINASVEQSAEKLFTSKIVVSASLNTTYKEANLISGYKINGLMKNAAGQNNSWIWTENRNVTAILKSDLPPTNIENTTIISDENSDVPVYMWFDNGIIYFYSKATKVYLNNYNEGMFQRFYNAKTIDLSMFDTSKATVMKELFFDDNSLLDIDLSNFDTSKVTNMSEMFYGAANLATLDVSNFDTSNVTDMSNMFYGLSSLNTLDVSNFDTSKVTNMKSMFNGLKNVTTLNLGNINTSKVTNMAMMFNNMNNVLSLDFGNNFNTSNVTDMHQMFKNTFNINSIDISTMDTSKVTNFEGMFYGTNASTIYVSDKFNTNSVTNSDGMFTDATNLVGGAGTVFDSEHIDASYAHVDGGTSNPGYFTLKTN